MVTAEQIAPGRYRIDMKNDLITFDFWHDRSKCSIEEYRKTWHGLDFKGFDGYNIVFPSPPKIDLLGAAIMFVCKKYNLKGIRIKPYGKNKD